jgi:hypothetical protein
MMPKKREAAHTECEHAHEILRPPDRNIFPILPVVDGSGRGSAREIT